MNGTQIMEKTGKKSRTRNQPKKITASLISLLFAFVFMGTALAHWIDPGKETFVRVVSADPDTRTYTFRCIQHNDPHYIKDWFIRPEDGNEEAIFLDWPWDQDLTYTFSGDKYYHIGCLIVNMTNTSQLWRGDIHIDLRKKMHTAEIVPLDVGINRVNVNCSYPSTNYGVEWWVSTYWGAASEPTRRIPLNTPNKTITYSPPGHGLYDPRCNVNDINTGVRDEATLAVEFFDDKAPYIPDQFGIDLNNNFQPFDFNTYMSRFSGQSIVNNTPPNGTGSPSTNNTNTTTPTNTTNTTGTPPGTTNSSCATKVQNVPATCEGGLISSDTFGGSRKLTCSSGANSLSVEAWDKPTATNPSYFEVYRKSFSGTGIKICLDGACIKDNGYAKSQNYPICSPSTNATGGTGGTGSNTTTGGSNTTNTTGGATGNTTTTVCSSQLQNLPVTCEGTITSDTFNGCRKLTCSSGANSMQINACNKPDAGSPQYFEIYKQAFIGSPLKICIGSACIKQEGYVKSTNYPMCFNSTVGAPNTTNTTGSIGGGAPNTTNNTEGTGGNTSATVCFSGLANLPKNCTGGTIVSDNLNGCRSLVCSNGGTSLSVMACNKPDTGAAQYYEIYKQVKTGTDQIELCLGRTCISDNGYAKSENYPICFTASGNESGANGSTGGTGPNSAPLAPTWLEPEPNAQNIDVVDFHIHAFDMVDDDGDRHIGSDFEIWDDAANQRVWAIDQTTNPSLLTHVHNGDGVFEGNLAGQHQLTYDAQYRVRARYYSNSTTNNTSPWSIWQFFRTRMPSNLTGGPIIWTARPGYVVELVTSGISVPVNIAAAPNLYGHLSESQRPLMYVTQLYGTVGLIKNDGSYHVYADNLLNYDVLGSIPGSGETGVDGIYADPTTGDLFVSMVYANASSRTGYYGKVVRFITNANGDGFTSMQTILRQIDVAPSHHIHQITRGPDGKLYVSVGDAHDTGSAKDTSKTSGKILRFNEDGSVPSDNPFPGKYFYAGGLRNPFGTAWRPGTNDLFVSNNGANNNDGLYKVARGDIYGWCCDTATGTWHLWPQITAPVQVIFNDGGSGFPSSEIGSMYVALSGATYGQGPSELAKRIVQFKFNPDGTKQSVSDFVWYTGSGYASPIGLSFGPDGLYFTDIYGEEGFVGAAETRGNVYKVVQGNGTGPTAPPTGFSVSIAPRPWYPKGLEMIWECKPTGGSGNFRYTIDFGDGQKTGEQNATTAYHKYAAPGTYTASCTARDMISGQMAIGTTTISLQECQPEDFQCN